MARLKYGSIPKPTRMYKFIGSRRKVRCNIQRLTRAISQFDPQSHEPRAFQNREAGGSTREHYEPYHDHDSLGHNTYDEDDELARSHDQRSATYQDGVNKLLEQWSILRPRLADLYNDSVSQCCEPTSCGCRETSWKLIAVGEPGRMRHIQKMTFTYRTCQDLSCVVFSNGFMPSSPQRPSFAITFDWLEFYGILRSFSGISGSAFVETLSDFIEMDSWNDIPQVYHRFVMLFDQWSYVVELADKKAFEALPGDAMSNAAPGTLSHQCLSCFYRPVIRREAPNSAYKSNAGNSSTAQGLDIGNLQVAADLQTSFTCDIKERIANSYYLAVDANLQHRRLADQSRGQVVSVYRSTFCDTSCFRPDPILKGRNVSSWATRHIDPHTLAFCKNSGPYTQDLLVDNYNNGDIMDHLPVSRSNGEDHRDYTSRSAHRDEGTQDTQNIETNQQPQRKVYTDPRLEKPIGCAHKFFAYNAASSSIVTHDKPKTMAAYDETGLVGVVCRHGVGLRYGNLWRGENQITVLKVLLNVLDDLPKESTIVVQYDIACKFKPFIQRLRPDLLNRVDVVLNAFHTYAHNLDCQLKYDPRLAEGVACSDGEGIERFWSMIHRFVPGGRISGPQHRQDVLHDQALRIAIQSRMRLPTTLARKFRRVNLELETSISTLTQAAEDWSGFETQRQGSKLEQYVLLLRQKFEDMRKRVICPEKLVHSEYNKKISRFPYTTFFQELCSLQEYDKLLHPSHDYQINGLSFWKNLDENSPSIRARAGRVQDLLRAANTSSGEQATFQDFFAGTAKWHLYFGEVCFVHLWGLQQRILAEADARKTEYTRVHSRFQGTKEASVLHRNIVSKAKKIEKGIAKHNLFIDWMQFVSPEFWSRADLMAKKLSSTQFGAEHFDAMESSHPWDQFKKLREFWNKDFELTVLKEDLAHIYAIHKYDRCVEELELLRIEATRYGSYYDRFFPNLVDPDAILRRRRCWHSFIRNCLTGVQDFINHAKLFGLDKIGESLAAQWDACAPDLLPSRSGFGQNWKLVRQRVARVDSDGIEIVDPLAQQIRERTHGSREIVTSVSEMSLDDDYNKNATGVEEQQLDWLDNNYAVTVDQTRLDSISMNADIVERSDDAEHWSFAY